MASKFGGIAVNEPVKRSRFGGVPTATKTGGALQGIQEELNRQRAGTEAERAARPSLGERTIGTAETALTLGAGIVAEPIAGLAGFAQALNPLAKKGAGAEAVKGVREFITEPFAPRTEEGQRQLGVLGEALAPVGEVFQAAEQASGDVGFELTGKPGVGAFGATLPTLFTELIGGGVLTRAVKALPTKIKNIVKAAPDGVQESILSAAKKRNVEILTSDLFAPTSWKGKTFRNISDKLGAFGVGKKREAQQAARVSAVSGYADELGIELDTPFADSLVKSITKKNAQTLQKAGEIRSQAIQKADEFGEFPTPKAVAKIDELLNRQTALGETADSKIIEQLTNFKAELTKENNFGMQAAQRTQLIRKRNQFAADQNKDVPAALQAVKSALDKDMIAFLRTKDAPATRKWLSSNRKFAEEADITKRTGIRQIIEKGDVKPEIVLTALKSGKPSELNRLHSQLTDKGRNTAKNALIQQALKDSRFFEVDINPNPDALATALNKANFQQASKVFFKGQDKVELDGFIRMLNATRQSQSGQAAIQTGVSNVPIVAASIAGGLAVKFPEIVVPAAVLTSAMVKAYESKLFRNLMIKLKNAEPGSTQALKIQEAAVPFILSAIQSTKDSEGSEE